MGIRLKRCLWRVTLSGDESFVSIEGRGLRTDGLARLDLAWSKSDVAAFAGLDNSSSHSHYT